MRPTQTRERLNGPDVTNCSPLHHAPMQKQVGDRLCDPPCQLLRALFLDFREALTRVELYIYIYSQKENAPNQDLWNLQGLSSGPSYALWFVVQVSGGAAPSCARCTACCGCTGSCRGGSTDVEPSGGAAPRYWT